MKLIKTILFFLLLTSTSWAIEYNYFDDSFWEPFDEGYGDWSGTNWTSDDAGGGLYVVSLIPLTSPAATWHVDFLPVSVSVTFASGTDQQIAVQDSNGNFIANKYNAGDLSGVHINLGFVGYDIASLQILDDESFTVTDISFYSSEGQQMSLSSSGRGIAISSSGMAIASIGSSAVSPPAPPEPGEYVLMIRNDGTEIIRNNGAQLIRNESP